MNKKILIALITILPASALADTTVGVGYDNIGVHTGNIHASLPAGKLTIGQTFGNYATGLALTAGSGNGLTYQHEQIRAAKLLPFDGGLFAPEILAGYESVVVPSGHIGAAYAGIGMSYLYPLGRHVSVSASAAFGRDFAAQATGLNTSSGLFYQAGAAVDIGGVGPGLVSIGYSYRHLPLSASGGLNLNTDGVQATYHIAF